MATTSAAAPDPGALAALPPAFAAAAQLKRPLLAGAGAAIVLAAAAGFAPSWLGSDTPAAFALYGLQLALVLFVSGWTVGLRHEILRARGEVDAAAASARSLDHKGADDLDPATELARFGRLGAPVILAFGALISLTFALIALGDRLGAMLVSPVVPPAAAAPYYAAGGIALVLMFPFVVCSRTLARLPAERLPEAASLAVWLRGGQWLAGLTGVALIVQGLNLVTFDLAAWIATALLLLTGMAALEMLARAAVRLLRAGADWRVVRAPVDLLTLAALFRGRNPLDSLLEAAEERLGFTLRTAFAMRFARRSLPVVLLGCGLLLWLSTALVVVQPEEEGVRLRFGRIRARTPVPPGLACKWPWPFETIERYSTRRVQALPLGFAGPRRTALLWTEAHAGVEYKLLLGDGRELVSVDAQVSYRIRDVIAFALHTQNPREILDALASRVLMRKTVTTDLDALLSVDRTRFSAGFTRALQAEADAMGLGLEILQTSFDSLHPPVRIAPEYQAVVGAEIERDTMIIRAEVDRAADLPRAEAEARTAILTAEAAGAAARARAGGDAVRFLAGLEGYLAAPELFRFRRWMEALEQGLSGLSFHVLDHTLDQPSGRKGAGHYWLDLRADANKLQRRP